MIIRTSIRCFAVLLLLGGCARQSNPPVSTETELDVCEAVFRYQFKNTSCASVVIMDEADPLKATEPNGPYYLSVRDTDPSGAFMRRFAKHPASIKKGSLFLSGTGVHFHIQGIMRVDADTFRVRADHYRSGHDASDDVYIVSETNGEWRVVSQEIISIS